MPIFVTMTGRGVGEVQELNLPSGFRTHAKFKGFGKGPLLPEFWPPQNWGAVWAGGNQQNADSRIPTVWRTLDQLREFYGVLKVRTRV